MNTGIASTNSMGEVCINLRSQVSHSSPVSLPRILCRDGESTRTGGTTRDAWSAHSPPSSPSGTIYMICLVYESVLAVR